MPAKWKESEVVVPRDQRGRIMRTDNPVKTYTHYYLKQTPSAELIKYLNDYSSKPKKIMKARNGNDKFLYLYLILTYKLKKED